MWSSYCMYGSVRAIEQSSIQYTDACKTYKCICTSAYTMGLQDEMKRQTRNSKHGGQYMLKKERATRWIERKWEAAYMGEKKWKSTVSMVTGRGTVLVVACESGSEWNIRCTDTKTHTCFCHFGGHCIDTHQLPIEEPNLTHLTAQLTWHLTEKCNVYPMRCRFLSWKVSSHNENNAGTHTHMHTPVSLLIL